MNTNDYEVWTPAEAAKVLRVNVKTLYDYLKQPGIPGVTKIGRQYRILSGPFLTAWANGSLKTKEEDWCKSLQSSTEVQR
jgi:excisionase family DNA binding protein